MDTPTALTRQHLIDPQLCLRCNGCEETCTKQAITHDWQNYAVDAALCDGCMACVEQCPTGAVDQWRSVPADEWYTLDEQLAWEHLPPAPLVDTPPAHGAPASAARAVELLFQRDAPASARVIENRCITPDSRDTQVHHIVLDLQGQAFPVLEGQTLGVLPPGVDALGHPHAMRAYSVASPREGEGGMPGRVALTVKRVTHDAQGQPLLGVCSNFLCDRVAGEEVHIVGPFGTRFLMPDDPDSRLILVATGTGIAPMRGMLEQRIRRSTAGTAHIQLFYGGRTRAALPYLDPLESRHGTDLQLHLALSREPGLPAQHVQAVLAQHAAGVLDWLDDARGHLYLCGLRGMESGVIDTLQAACAATGRHWHRLHDQMKAEHRIHIETY